MDVSSLVVSVTELGRLPPHLKVLPFTFAEPSDGFIGLEASTTSVATSRSPVVSVDEGVLLPHTLSPARRSEHLPPHLRFQESSTVSVSSAMSTGSESSPVGIAAMSVQAIGKFRAIDQLGLVPQEPTISNNSVRSTISAGSLVETATLSANATGKARVMDQPELNLATPANAQGKAKAVDQPAPTPRIRTGDAAEWTRKTEAEGLAKMAKPYPCSYNSCALGFDTVRLLKKHKMERHDYCKKCDMDFRDWEDHLAHRVGSPSHITCPSCGEDFKSSGGRDLHIRSLHPNPQDLHCPGCGTKFVRAGSLIDHIEKNGCSRISTDQFDRFRAVHAIREAHLSTLTREEIEDEDVPVLGAESVTDTTFGGVELGPEEDISSLKYPTLAPAPAASSQSPVEGPQPVLRAAYVGGVKGSSYAEKARGNLTTVAQAASVSAPVTAENIAQLSTGLPLVPKKAPAWAIMDPNSKYLFPESKPREVDDNKPRDVQEILTRMVIGQPRDSPLLKFTNGQPVEAINPESDLFNPDAFKDALDRYKCPYPGCGKTYTTRQGFVSHLCSSAHKGMDHRCPECLKMFKSATALTQHMEAPGSRCRIKDSKNYGKIVGLVSGGIIAVEGQYEDGTVRYEAAEPEW